RQLVNLARGLILQPQILLLDEPTANVDAGTVSRIAEILNQLYEKHQTTILMVTHQLKLAQMFCTQLLHLQQGSLITNQPASQINWNNLQESLKQAETDNDFDF
ncbi:MAG: methionine ABC transporter ATP-binding protein, partial [Rivularia sp. ALOHA_DT_140]|nr:methionine ABC transporter ATP-binding protein [Rivularia sp. ALOHA_DT_140]